MRSCIYLLGVLALAGCTTASTTSSSGRPPEATEVVVVEPTAEEIRAEQIRKQREDIDALRDALAENRARADSAAARSSAETRQAQSEIRALQAKLAEMTKRAEEADTRSDPEIVQAQSEIRALQAQLGEVRARADAAAAQSDKAFAIATEFLSNLVAAREEQRSIVERNISTFGGMEQRLAEIEQRISETRQLSQAEIAATRTQSSVLEQRLSESDSELTALREQLLLVHKQNEETRASLDSGPMLQMLRQLEGTQRDTSGLRGAFEEMQQEQEAARKRMQNYYLDLDARIQALQAKERAAREAELEKYEEEIDEESITADETATVEDESIVLDPPSTEGAEPAPSAENTDSFTRSGEPDPLAEIAPVPDGVGPGDYDAGLETTGADPAAQADQGESGDSMSDAPLEEAGGAITIPLTDIADRVDIPDKESASDGSAAQADQGESASDTQLEEAGDAIAGSLANSADGDITDMETAGEDPAAQIDAGDSSSDVKMDVPGETSVDVFPNIVDTVDIMVDTVDLMPREADSASEGMQAGGSDDASVAADQGMNEQFNPEESEPAEPEASVPEADAPQTLAQTGSSTGATLEAADKRQPGVHAVIITDWTIDN